MSGLVKFFYERVINGKKWYDVPATWQKRVKEQLIADGYTLNDDGTVTKQDKPETEE